MDSVEDAELADGDFVAVAGGAVGAVVGAEAVAALDEDLVALGAVGEDVVGLAAEEADAEEGGFLGLVRAVVGVDGHVGLGIGLAVVPGEALFRVAGQVADELDLGAVHVEFLQNLVGNPLRGGDGLCYVHRISRRPVDRWT